MEREAQVGRVPASFVEEMDRLRAWQESAEEMAGGKARTISHGWFGLDVKA